MRHRAAVPTSASVPRELRRRVFQGTTVVRLGLLTKNQLRSAAWQRLFPDVYADCGLELTHAIRAGAAARWLVPGAVVTGRSAAVMWGVDLAGADDDVELTMPPDAHPRRVPGLRVRRATLPAEHVGRRSGVPVTTPAATAVRLAALLGHDDTVIAMDQLVASGVVELAELRASAVTARGAGSARARAAAADADGLAESPQETRLRLLVHRSSLPCPVAQHRIEHAGQFVARVDFAWPEAKVALEYDGLWHADPVQFAKDRARLNRLQAAGWRIVFVTAADLRNPGALILRIASALGCAVAR
jgi:very-short-patch-repair endonuclease